MKISSSPLRRTLAWTSLLLSTVQGTYGMLDPEALEAALKGESPLYGISVTRSTENNSEDEYKSLQDSQIYLIMCVLKAVLGQPVEQEYFEKELNSIVKKELEKYQKLNNQFNEKVKTTTDEMIENHNKVEIALLNNIELYPINIIWNEFKDHYDSIKELDRKNIDDGLKKIAKIIFDKVEKLKKDDPKLKNYNTSERMIISIEKKYVEFKKKSLINLKNENVLKSFSKLEQQFLEYWKFKKIDLLKEDYLSIYKNTFNKLSNLKKKSSIINNIGLIAFNEMFFGKSVSFSKTKMEDLFKEFTKNFENKLFFINYLVNSSKKFENIEHRNQFIDEQLERSSQEKYFEIKQETPKDTQIFNDYQNGLKNLKETNQHLEMNMLENISVVFLQGLPLTYYNKSTYFQEEDNFLKRKDDVLGKIYLYVSGDKKDHKINHDENPELTSSDKEILNRLQKISLNHIATEICYDLEIGVRKEADTYPENLTLHLVPSNTLPFKESILNTLPEKAKLVWHVDPKEQSIYSQYTLVNLNESTENQISWEQTSLNDVKLFFELDNSKYLIKILKLQPLLKTEPSLCKIL